MHVMTKKETPASGTKTRLKFWSLLYSDDRRSTTLIFFFYVKL